MVKYMVEKREKKYTRGDTIVRKNKKKERKPGEPIVIEFNLSKSVVITIAIIVLIATITTAKVVTTIIQGEENKTLANEETSNERVTYVNSTTKDADGNVVNETDANGNIVQVPVPKGYSASQIDGETTVSKGFVIYEGDVDWSTILVGDGNNTDTTTNTESIDTTENEETKPAVEENIATADTVTEENVTVETTTAEEKDDSDNINNSDENNNENKMSESKQNDKIAEEVSDIENEITTEADTTANEDDATGTTDTVSEADNIDGTDTTEDETPTQQDINIFNLQKSRNQYVWVPVDDPSRIYGVDSNGKIWGKLYNFSSSGRTLLNWTENNAIMNITDRNTSYREPDVISSNSFDTDGYSDMSKYGLGETRYEMLAQELEENYYEIIASIKKYGGFYIGRYETGGLNGTAVVRKMDTNIASQNWYTMYKKCLTLKENNDNIKTSMILGSLWDETIEWLVKSEATNSEGTTLTYQLVGRNSTTWGNYHNATFKYIAQNSEKPEATENKNANSDTRIPTGSAEYTKANNIYDMAGNVWDWTTEAYSTNYRGYRGGSHSYVGSSRPAASRSSSHPSNDDYYIRLSRGTLC